VGGQAAAAILAGGAARRFGGTNKAHLVVAGDRIIDRQLAVLRPRFADIAIVADDARPWTELGLPVIPDVARGVGPLAGIAAALAWSPCPRLFVIGCDMPFVDLRAIELLLSKSGDAVAPVVGGRPEPLFAVYSRACAAAIERMLAAGHRKTAGLLDEARATRVDEAELRAIDPELRFLVNINSPTDLRSVES